MSVHDLSDFLRERAKALNLSAKVIVQKAGISRQTWYRLINAQVKKARLETLERVANVLQVSLVELSYLYTKQQQLQQEALISIVHITNNHPFVDVVSIPSDALVHKEEVFEKQWKITNKSPSYWINRRLVCVDDEIDIRLKPHNSLLYAVEHKQGLTSRCNTAHCCWRDHYGVNAV